MTLSRTHLWSCVLLTLTLICCGCSKAAKEVEPLVSVQVAKVDTVKKQVDFCLAKNPLEPRAMRTMQPRDTQQRPPAKQHSNKPHGKYGKAPDKGPAKGSATGPAKMQTSHKSYTGEKRFQIPTSSSRRPGGGGGGGGRQKRRG